MLKAKNCLGCPSLRIKPHESVSSKPFVCNNCHVQATKGYYLITHAHYLLTSLFFVYSTISIYHVYKGHHRITETLISFIKYHFGKCCTKILGKVKRIHSLWSILINWFCASFCTLTFLLVIEIFSI